MPLKLAIIQTYTLTSPNTEAALVINACEAWESEMLDLGIDLEIAAQAYKEVARTTKFMPKLSEVLDMILGSPDTNALNAWVDVLVAHRSFESVYRKLAFSDAQIHVAIESMGGWTALYDAIQARRHAGDSLEWIKKEFIQAYKSSRRKPQYKYLLARKSSYKKEPLLIGDVDKCKKLLTASTTESAPDGMRRIGAIKLKTIDDGETV